LVGDREMDYVIGNKIVNDHLTKMPYRIRLKLKIDLHFITTLPYIISSCEAYNICGWHNVEQIQHIIRRRRRVKKEIKALLNIFMLLKVNKRRQT
jgi:hypothetical protein